MPEKASQPWCSTNPLAKRVTVDAVRIAAPCVLLMSVAANAVADPRDAFGFAKKAPAPPMECGDELLRCAQAPDPLAEDGPFSLATWLPAAYLLSLPVGNATHDDVAHYALGTSRDGAGPSVVGGNGLENRWTVDGAPTDDVRTGAAGTRIPLAFLEGIFVTTGGFAARDRTSTGGTIDARLKRGTPAHELSARAWAGVTAPSFRPPVAAQTYQLRKLVVDAGTAVGASVVATGPLGSLWGGKAWYAAGLAPEFDQSKLTFSASGIVDADNDGVPDGLPGVVATRPIGAMTTSPRAWSVPAMVRLGLDREHHHLELTFVGSAGSSTRFLANSTLQAAGIDAVRGVGDGIATWRGQWPSTRARVQAAWHRSVRRESARDPRAANMPQLLSAYVPGSLIDDAELARVCADGTTTDPYPSLVNCPIPIGWFSSGGAGLLADTTGDRPSVTVDVAHRIGANVVRAGATGEDARLITTSRFTGRHQVLSLFPEQTLLRRFVDPNATCPDDPTQPCAYSDTSTLRYRTRYVAAYLEDTWQASPDIAVDGGMRWELMWVGTTLKFSSQLSPRLGWTWDPLGNGQSRLWTSMGRAYALLPTGLGATVLQRAATVDDIAFGNARLRTVNSGTPLPVAPGVSPIAQDELTVGAQVSIARLFTITGWLQGRWLRRGLESTSAGFDNPGRTDGRPALRDTVLGAIEIATPPRAKVVLRAGYVYSRTTGSWLGAYDPRVGAVLYDSTDFNASSVNQLGALPTDGGHQLYVEAQHRGRIGEVDLSAAARFALASGRPRDALGQGDSGIVYLIARGAAGRGPLVSQTNLRFAASWRGVGIALDLFNVFDRENAAGLDPLYTSDSIRPIHGGSAEDLVFLKSNSERPATRRPAFRAVTGFESPISAVLSLYHMF